MLYDQETVTQGDAMPPSAEAVNPEVQPKAKLKPVVAGQVKPTTAGMVQPVAGGILTASADQFTPPTPAKGQPNPAVATALPGGTLTTTADQMTPAPANPGATALPGGMITSTAAPAPAAPAPVAPTPQAASGPGAAVGLNPTDPNNALTGQTITPGAGVDRFALAQQKFDQFAASTDPAYQAALRQANRYGAAQGRLGSGSLRTDFGNLANQRSQALDQSRQGFLTNALEGTIGDNWNAIGLAERQQGFQNNQQQQAFANELARLGFDDSMLNSAFGRALQTWMAGQTGGTGTGTAMAGANTYGNQAQDALAALANLTRARSAAGGTAPATTTTPTPAGDIWPWMGGVNG